MIEPLRNQSINSISCKFPRSIRTLRNTTSIFAISDHFVFEETRYTARITSSLETCCFVRTYGFPLPLHARPVNVSTIRPRTPKRKRDAIETLRIIFQKYTRDLQSEIHEPFESPWPIRGRVGTDDLLEATSSSIIYPVVFLSRELEREQHRRLLWCPFTLTVQQRYTLRMLIIVWITPRTVIPVHGAPTPESTAS